MERYLQSVLGQEILRLLFRVRTGSAELLKDKKRCEMIKMRGVLCVRVVQEKIWSIIGDVCGFRGIGKH